MSVQITLTQEETSATIAALKIALAINDNAPPTHKLHQREKQITTSALARIAAAAKKAAAATPPTTKTRKPQPGRTNPPAPFTYR